MLINFRFCDQQHKARKKHEKIVSNRSFKDSMPVLTYDAWYRNMKKKKFVIILQIWIWIFISIFMLIRYHRDGTGLIIFIKTEMFFSFHFISPKKEMEIFLLLELCDYFWISFALRLEMSFYMHHSTGSTLTNIRHGIWERVCIDFNYASAQTQQGNWLNLFALVVSLF